MYGLSSVVEQVERNPLSILFRGLGFRARLNNGYFLVCKSIEPIDDLVDQTVGGRQSLLNGPQNGQGFLVLGS